MLNYNSFILLDYDVYVLDVCVVFIHFIVLAAVVSVMGLAVH